MEPNTQIPTPNIKDTNYQPKNSSFSHLFVFSLLLISLVVNGILVFSLFFNPQNKPKLVNAPMPAKIKNILVNSGPVLDFKKSKTISGDHLPLVDNLIPSYAKKNGGGAQVNGQELEGSLSDFVTIEEGIDMSFVEMMSVGRYSKSLFYDGTVYPTCENTLCNYSYGGFLDGKSKLVITMKFKNQTNKSLVMQPSVLRLYSKEQTYKQWKFDRTLEPYSETYVSFVYDVPAENDLFFLEINKDEETKQN